MQMIQKMNTASYSGDVLLDKQEIGGMLKFFHDNFKDITFHEGVGLKINQSNYSTLHYSDFVTVFG